MSIRARPRTCLRDPISGLAWENLGMIPVELVERNVCSHLPGAFMEPPVNLTSHTGKKEENKKSNQKAKR